MPDLLLELFSEEIPARMQARGAEDLKRLVTDRLVDAGLVYESANAYATPRRLALSVRGIPVRQPDVREVKRGPRVGANEQAIAGFLRSAGLTSIEQASIEQDAKKGMFYTVTSERAGRDAKQVIADIVPEVVRGFPWPKSMRWGEGTLRWVRPLHSIVATFGIETEDPEIIPFDIDGIQSGDITYGHRFLAPEPIRVRRFGDYVAKLEAGKVVLDPARRREIIINDAKNLAFAQGFALVDDIGLLDELGGLVEWPVVFMGAFDARFLTIPPEVIRTTIRNTQRCFVLRDPQARPFAVGGASTMGGSDATSTPGLANRFIMVANTEATDGGRTIVAGNERVIQARLSDAKYFWDMDLKTPLDERLSTLSQITFHEKLGSQIERVERIERLARFLAPLVDADPEEVSRAARLCKADLVTEMVGEFPDLQGLMGKYYAQAHGESDAVATAIADHYRPLGPNDRVPQHPVAIAVAIADKIDTLVGFWSIDEKPSGSKDPYALRRAALGVIRIVLENELRLSLLRLIDEASKPILGRKYYISRAKDLLDLEKTAARMISDVLHRWAGRIAGSVEEYEADQVSELEPIASDLGIDLLDFFADRLKVQLRDRGTRFDLVDAVFAVKNQDDLVMIVRRVDALARFLETDDGRNLLAGYRRAANILRIEEKKDGQTYVGMAEPQMFAAAEEKALSEAIHLAREDIRTALVHEDLEAAMAAMARLRPHVDAFFERVTVNAEDADIRANRLRLLNEIRETTRTIADFSHIEG